MSAYAASPVSRTHAGIAYVVFGKASYSADIDFNTFTSGSAGFRILGAAASDGLGSSVSAAGDVNSDGFDDLIVGAPFHSLTGRSNCGTAYVIFGKASTFADIDTSTFTTSTTTGFRIFGAQAGDKLGWSVASVGDLNNDGIGDITVGATTASPGLPSRSNAGAVYVIYGSTALGTVDVDLSTFTPASEGLFLQGAAANNQAGYAVSSAGDFDGDGKLDLMIGSSKADAGAITQVGNVDVLLSSKGAFGPVVSNSSLSSSPSLSPTLWPSLLASTCPSVNPSTDPSPMPTLPGATNSPNAPTSNPSAVPSAVSSPLSLPPAVQPSLAPSASGASSSSTSSISTGSVVGIAVGCFVLGCLLAHLIFLFCKRRNAKKMKMKELPEVVTGEISVMLLCLHW